MEESDTRNNTAARRYRYGLLLGVLVVTVWGSTAMAQKIYQERRAEYYRQSAVYEQELRQWQSARERELKRPDGWLALSGFAWLQDGSSSMGSGDDMQIQLPGGPDYWGTISARDGKVAFLPADDSGVLVNGKAVPLAALVVDDQGEPTIVSAGSYSFRVIRRQQLAIRVRDAQAPLLTEFKGLDYFPIKTQWRVPARYIPNPSGTTLSITNVLGQEEHMPNPGALQFSVDGKQYQLQALVEEGSDQLFVIIADRTSGKQTYGAGRFIYVDYPNLDGVTEIDFNKAYNPPCAFTAFSSCPLPPDGNRLSLPVEAGEKLYRHGG